MQYKQVAAMAAVLGLAFVLSTSGPYQAFASPPSLSASSQSVSVDENGSVGITLAGSGPSNFTYVVATQPAHGVLTGTAPNLAYTPDTNYFGSDSFTFHTHKGGNDSTDATVSITVNEVVVVVPPLTCDEGFHIENGVCVADSTGDNGSGSNSTDTGSGSGTNSTDTSSTPVNHGRGANDEIYFDGLAVGNGLKLELNGAPIPTDPEHQSLYMVSPFAIFVAMSGANDAGYVWNNLSDAQQAWIVFHLDELYAEGSS